MPAWGPPGEAPRGGAVPSPGRPAAVAPAVPSRSPGANIPPSPGGEEPGPAGENLKVWPQKVDEQDGKRSAGFVCSSSIPSPASNHNAKGNAKHHKKIKTVVSNKYPKV